MNKADEVTAKLIVDSLIQVVAKGIYQFLCVNRKKNEIIPNDVIYWPEGDEIFLVWGSNGGLILISDENFEPTRIIDKRELVVIGGYL